MNLVLFMVGSCLGALFRFIISLHINRWTKFRFPYGTLFVNLLGCFLAGLILGRWKEDTLFLDGGFLGSFTTLSTWILEMDNQLTKDSLFHALINLVVSVGGGFFLFFLGRML